MSHWRFDAIRARQTKRWSYWPLQELTARRRSGRLHQVRLLSRARRCRNSELRSRSRVEADRRNPIQRVAALSWLPFFPGANGVRFFFELLCFKASTAQITVASTPQHNVCARGEVGSVRVAFEQPVAGEDREMKAEVHGTTHHDPLVTAPTEWCWLTPTRSPSRHTSGVLAPSPFVHTIDPGRRPTHGASPH